VAADAILVVVKQAPGMRTCQVEISTNPSDPASWKRVKGGSGKRTLTGYAPGTYWLRACSVRGADESDYTVAVAVVVK
jgi:hypothetical protein